MTGPGQISPWSFAAARRPDQLNSFRAHRRILLQVIFIHICLIFVPPVLELMQPEPPITIEVSLIDAPLMTAPEVGDPKRVVDISGEPSPPEPSPTPPSPPEPRPTPPSPPEPSPTPPSPPEPRPSPPSPPEPRPTPPSPPEPSPKPPKPPQPPSPPAPKPPVGKTPKKQNTTTPDQRLRPGDKTQGQAQGETSKNPPGGTQQSESEYGKLVGDFIMAILQNPGGTLLKGEIQKVTIKITINSSGKITAKALVSPSKNTATNEVVKIMLRDLKEVPRPPDGKPRTLELILTFEQDK